MIVALRRAERGVRAAPVPALPRPPAARQHVVPPGRRRRPRDAAGARTTRGCTSTPSRRTRCRARGCCACSATSIRTARPRRWRVGEPFEAHAQRYLGAIGRPLPGSAWLLRNGRHHQAPPHRVRPRHAAAARPRQGRRGVPARRARRRAVDFAPGTTWVVYSDQVLHAAMGGQHMMEQTFLLEVEHLRQPRDVAAANARAAAAPAAALATRTPVALSQRKRMRCRRRHIACA